MRLSVIIFCFALLLTQGGSLAQKPTVKGKGSPSQAILVFASPKEAKLHEVLSGETIMDFKAAPLIEVVEYLKEQHKTLVILDFLALQRAKLKPAMPVSINLRGTSLASALNIMSRLYPLGWYVKDGFIVITSKQGERTTVYVRSYNLASLCKTEGDAKELTSTVAKLVGGSRSSKSDSDRQPAVASNYKRLLLVNGNRRTHATVVDILKRVSQAPSPSVK